MMTGIKVILADKFDSHIRRQLIFTLGLNPYDASLLKFRKPSRESRENQSHKGTAAIYELGEGLIPSRLTMKTKDLQEIHKKPNCKKVTQR
jgi:hypothetical protein